MRVPLTISDHLFRAALVYPDRIAVIDEPGGPGSLGRLSYRDLDARARGMALHLDRLEVPEGARVAIVSPNSARFLASFWGVSGYGRVLVPINFRLNREEIAYIVRHSDASVLLVDPEQAEMVADIPVRHKIVLDGADDADLFARAPDDAEPRRWAAQEDATCSINYTSGTTARPKGVQLTHRNCWLNAAIFGWHIGVSDRDTLLHTLPMFHCNGWGTPYAATAMGARQVILRKVDGEEILRRIEAEGVTLLCGAPAVVAAALQAAEQRIGDGVAIPGRDSVRVVVAGAPPPRKTIERVEADLGWEFIQIYGLTETSPLLTINRRRPEWDELSTSDRAALLMRAGVPALGVQTVLDAEGEILARSNHVFEGYWQQPDESAQAIPDGWFHTGDGGFLDGPYVVLSDRKKDVIITGGENVSSIEVEDVLYQHPSVSEACVIGVPDEKWGETIKALVVVRSDSSVSEAELIAFCRERLSHFKCPTSVEFRDELLRTATGKLQKFKIREPYWRGLDRQIN